MKSPRFTRRFLRNRHLNLEVDIKDAEVRNLRMKLDSLKILEIRNQNLGKSFTQEELG